MKAGWEFRPLGEVCIFENGDRGKNYPGRKAFVPTGVPFINAGHIADGEIDWDGMNYIPEEHFERISRGKISQGDLLFCLRGSLGKFGHVAQPMQGAIASSLVIIRCKLDISVEFLKYFLRSESCDEQIAKYAGGAAQPNLGATDLKKFKIPLPPLDEQKRIVAVLDAAFEGLTRARAHAEANLQNARELFESQLKLAFSKNSGSWQKAKLKNLTNKIGSGATPRGGEAAYKSVGTSLIRSLNVHDRNFRHAKLAHIDDQQADKLSNVIVQKDDVLLNITGASVARCCQVDNSVLPARVNQHVAIIRTKPEKLLASFLCYELTSETIKELLLKTGDEGGATRQAITKAQIQELEVFFPASLAEQKSLVEILKSQEDEATTLEELYREKIADLDDLRQSLLQKAFAGELT